MNHYLLKSFTLVLRVSVENVNRLLIKLNSLIKMVGKNDKKHRKQI